MTTESTADRSTDERIRSLLSRGPVFRSPQAHTPGSLLVRILFYLVLAPIGLVASLLIIVTTPLWGPMAVLLNWLKNRRARLRLAADRGKATWQDHTKPKRKQLGELMHTAWERWLGVVVESLEAALYYVPVGLHRRAHVAYRSRVLRRSAKARVRAADNVLQRNLFQATSQLSWNASEVSSETAGAVAKRLESLLRTHIPELSIQAAEAAARVQQGAAGDAMTRLLFVDIERGFWRDAPSDPDPLWTAAADGLQRVCQQGRLDGIPLQSLLTHLDQTKAANWKDATMALRILASAPSPKPEIVAALKAWFEPPLLDSLVDHWVGFHWSPREGSDRARFLLEETMQQAALALARWDAISPGVAESLVLGADRGQFADDRRPALMAVIRALEKKQFPPDMIPLVLHAVAHHWRPGDPEACQAFNALLDANQSPDFARASMRAVLGMDPTGRGIDYWERTIEFAGLTLRSVPIATSSLEVIEAALNSQDEPVRKRAVAVLQALSEANPVDASTTQLLLRLLRTASLETQALAARLLSSVIADCRTSGTSFAQLSDLWAAWRHAMLQPGPDWYSEERKIRQSAAAVLVHYQETGAVAADTLPTGLTKDLNGEAIAMVKEDVARAQAEAVKSGKAPHLLDTWCDWATSTSDAHQREWLAWRISEAAEYGHVSQRSAQTLLTLAQMPDSRLRVATLPGVGAAIGHGALGADAMKSLTSAVAGADTDLRDSAIEGFRLTAAAGKSDPTAEKLVAAMLKGSGSDRALRAVAEGFGVSEVDAVTARRLIESLKSGPWGPWTSLAVGRLAAAGVEATACVDALAKALPRSDALDGLGLAYRNPSLRGVINAAFREHMHSPEHGYSKRQDGLRAMVRYGIRMPADDLRSILFDDSIDHQLAAWAACKFAASGGVSVDTLEQLAQLVEDKVSPEDWGEYPDALTELLTNSAVAEAYRVFAMTHLLIMVSRKRDQFESGPPKSVENALVKTGVVAPGVAATLYDALRDDEYGERTLAVLKTAAERGRVSAELWRCFAALLKMEPASGLARRLRPAAARALGIRKLTEARDLLLSLLTQLTGENYRQVDSRLQVAVIQALTDDARACELDVPLIAEALEDAYARIDAAPWHDTERSVYGGMYDHNHEKHDLICAFLESFGRLGTRYPEGESSVIAKLNSIGDPHYGRYKEPIGVYAAGALSAGRFSSPDAIAELLRVIEMPLPPHNFGSYRYQLDLKTAAWKALDALWRKKE